MTQDLTTLSATQALSLFGDKKLSPVELMAAIIERSELVEPHTNAFSHRYFDEALNAARLSENRWMKGEPMGPLDGLPVAMKDEIDVEGQPCTEGSLLYQDRIIDQDAVLTARLRAAGALFHARTTCPEFCSLWNTKSRLFGVTRNPWNLDITPGGSSGGSGASLAAGTCLLATGSDIGGSIRFPAAMSGIVGYKPPYGRVPETYAPFNMEAYCANGPMAKTVADTALMQNILSGEHPIDAASALAAVELPTKYPSSLEGVRLAYTMDFGWFDVEDDVQRNTLNMIDRARDLGALVEEVSLDWPDKIDRAYYGHMDPLFYASLDFYRQDRASELCDYSVMLAEEATERLKETDAFYNAALVESEMYAEFGALMDRFDAFLCPTSMTTGLKADFDPVREKYFVGGKEQDNDLGIAPCYLFNMMGRCPSMSIPSGVAGNGVPTGLHIATGAYRDEQVFRVAAALELPYQAPNMPFLD